MLKKWAKNTFLFWWKRASKVLRSIRSSELSTAIGASADKISHFKDHILPKIWQMERFFWSTVWATKMSSLAKKNVFSEEYLPMTSLIVGSWLRRIAFFYSFLAISFNIFHVSDSLIFLSQAHIFLDNQIFLLQKIP